MRAPGTCRCTAGAMPLRWATAARSCTAGAPRRDWQSSRPWSEQGRLAFRTLHVSASVAHGSAFGRRRNSPPPPQPSSERGSPRFISTPSARLGSDLLPMPGVGGACWRENGEVVSPAEASGKTRSAKLGYLGPRSHRTHPHARLPALSEAPEVRTLAPLAPLAAGCPSGTRWHRRRGGAAALSRQARVSRLLPPVAPLATLLLTRAGAPTRLVVTTLSRTARARSALFRLRVGCAEVRRKRRVERARWSRGLERARWSVGQSQRRRRQHCSYGRCWLARQRMHPCAR